MFVLGLWLKSCLRPPFVFIAVLIFLAITAPTIGETSVFIEKEKTEKAVIDIHSNISDGLRSPENIAQLAQEKGISVLIFGDSALRRWEYGLWPLRNIIKKTYQENSVLRLGADKYLKIFAYLRGKFPDLVLIPGVEVSPFFYWEGSPFRKNFAIIDYYKQFLVIGLKPKDYQNMPIVGNRRFFYFSKNTLLALWPLLLIIFGLKIIFKKKILGAPLIMLGIIFLINNLPFPTSRFNVYQGYQGTKPYQDLIDYVNRKGGLIFWAHPEMVSQKVYHGVEFYTASHLEDLLLTHDYTGVGVSPKMGEPGGIWDKLLLEYIEGKRKKPVWIISAQHYTGFAKDIDYPRTFFFAKQPKPQEIIDALRQGRMYVRFKLQDLENEPVSLEEFVVKPLRAGAVQIMIKGSQISCSEPLKIELIRNGNVFKSFEELGSDWVIRVEDSLSPKEPKAYYRLRIVNPSTIILSNPVFTEDRN